MPIRIAGNLPVPVKAANPIDACRMALSRNARLMFMTLRQVRRHENVTDPSAEAQD